MTVKESKLSKHIEATYRLKIGDFHFFKNFVVAEFNEGVYASYKDLEESYDLALDYYKDRSYGFISNRINSYSINIMDVLKYQSKFKGLRAYAIVTHNRSSKISLQVEDYYFKLKRTRFNSLIDAAKWVNDKINASQVDKFHLL